jgi:hypothetical protein
VNPPNRPRLHFRKPQPPLYQWEHPPAVDSGNDPRGGKAFGLELLQGTENGLELLLVLACYPPALVVAGGGHHSLRKRWQQPVIIPEIKPPVLPPLV